MHTYYELYALFFLVRSGGDQVLGVRGSSWGWGLDVALKDGVGGVRFPLH